jgi:hypothetical protein
LTLRKTSSIILGLICLTGCSSDSVSESDALITLACSELDAYNDLIDAGDEGTANRRWNRVLQIQSQLNEKRGDSEQISNNDWGFICSQ